MKKSGLLIFLFFSFTFKLSGQKTGIVSFTPTIEKESMIINKLFNLDSISFQITNLKYYISDFSILYKGKLVASSSQKYNLIDFESVEKSQFTVNFWENLPFDIVTFKLGVDSLASISGVYEGNLDPMNGMYWTWQSGFINFKLEGISPNCLTRQNKFQLHIGGYQAPFNMMREVVIPVNHKGKNEIIIELNLETLLAYMFKNKIFNIMSPGHKAVSIADFFPTIFSIK